LGVFLISSPLNFIFQQFVHVIIRKEPSTFTIFLTHVHTKHYFSGDCAQAFEGLFYTEIRLHASSAKMYGVPASVTSLDKDMRKLRMDRYTPQAAKEVRDWIERTLGEHLAPGDLMEALKDGVALCKYVYHR
jgi:hypothetical protein